MNYQNLQILQSSRAEKINRLNDLKNKMDQVIDTLVLVQDNIKGVNLEILALDQSIKALAEAEEKKLKEQKTNENEPFPDY